MLRGSILLALLLLLFHDLVSDAAVERFTTVRKKFGDEAMAKVLKLITESKGSKAALFQAQLPFLLATFANQSTLENMTNSIDDTFFSAAFETIAIDARKEFAARYDPSLGRCFTFNHYSAEKKFRIRTIGKWGSLRVMLKINQSEYYPWVDTAAYSIFIHPIGTDVTSETPHFSVGPDTFYRIGIDRNEFVALGGVYGKCVSAKGSSQRDYTGGDYTINGCKRSCYQDAVMRACGCYDPSYPHPSNSTACDFRKSDCVADVTRNGDASVWPECDCPQPCHEQTYDVQISHAPLAYTGAWSKGIVEVELIIAEPHTMLRKETPQFTLFGLLVNTTILAILFGVATTTVMEVRVGLRKIWQDVRVPWT